MAEFHDKILVQSAGLIVKLNISQDSSSSCLFSDEFVIIYKEIREAVHNE